MIRYQGTLEDACELIADCPHTTAKDEGEGYPLVRTPNIGFGRLVYDKMHRVSESVYNCRNRRAKPVAGDLIYAREAPAGNVALITAGENVCLGQRTVLIRPKRDVVNSVYLTYYLLDPSQRNRLLSTASGATVTHVNLPAIRGLSVSFPDLKLQNQIADILGAYDDLIENNRRRIELLEKMARELYRERFVRREPKSSPCKLGELIEVCYGKDHKKLLAGEVPVYGSGGIMRNVDRALYSGEAILIPRKGTLNNVMYVNGDFWTVDTMFYAKPKNWYVAPYVYQLLSSMNLMTFNSGTAVPSMTTEILNSMPVLLPEEEHLRAYAGMFGVMFSERILLESQNRNLVKQRDRLLPRLMSGKIELDKLVKEAE